MPRRKNLSDSSWSPSRVNIWHSLYRAGAKRVGEEVDLSADLRLWMLATSRVGASGHSVWEPNELRESLLMVHRKSGELRPASRSYVDKVIAALRRSGMVAPDSNQRCMVLAMDVLRVNESSRITCPEHRHLFAWDSRTGWVELDRQRQVIGAAPTADAA